MIPSEIRMARAVPNRRVREPQGPQEQKVLVACLEQEEEKLPERRKERGLSGPRRWREEGLREDSVANSIREVECNDPEKSLWEFHQEVTEDFLKSDFSGGGVGGVGQ